MNKETKPKKSVREYLDSLVWDKKPRLDRWLIDYADAADTPHVRTISRGMLVGAVRRARHPGRKLDEMTILEGPQGSGKSAALRILAIEDAWFTDDFPSADEQRLVEATAGKWIVEATELKGMSAGDVAALKACLSRSQDSLPRRPYAREGEKVPRQFVIVGTTSATEYLHDTTGNRRFWPVRVERFDLDRLRVDRDQLWAEAAAVESRGDVDPRPFVRVVTGEVLFGEVRYEALGTWMRVDPRVTDAHRAEVIKTAHKQLARADPTDGDLAADHLARLILALLGEEP